MKRLPLYLIVALCAGTALGFDPHASTGDRIVVLRSAERDAAPREWRAISLVADYLVEELEEAGFDAEESDLTYRDLMDGEDEEADYYVEVVRAFRSDDPYGGAFVSGRHGGVEVGVVVSHLSAAIRIYDGRTLDIIDEIDVVGRDRGVAPTAIGVGRRHVGIWLGMPITRLIRDRSVAHEAAREAARAITRMTRSEARAQ